MPLGPCVSRNYQCVGFDTPEPSCFQLHLMGLTGPGCACARLHDISIAARLAVVKPMLPLYTRLRPCIGEKLDLPYLPLPTCIGPLMPPCCLDSHGHSSLCNALTREAPHTLGSHEKVAYTGQNTHQSPRRVLSSPLRLPKAEQPPPHYHTGR